VELAGCLSSGVFRWRSRVCTVWNISRWRIAFLRSGRDVWGVVGSVCSSCALWNTRCSIVEGPEFHSRIVCEGGERVMSWRSYGFNMCVGMASGSIVGLYVELAMVVEQRVLQSNVSAGIHSDEKTGGAMNHWRAVATGDCSDLFLLGNVKNYSSMITFKPWSTSKNESKIPLTRHQARRVPQRVWQEERRWVSWKT